MEESQPAAAPPEPAKGKKGLWIGIVVVVLVIILLLAAALAGLFGPGAGPPFEAVFFVGYPGDGDKIVPEWWANRAQWGTEWLWSEGLKTQDFIDRLADQGIDVTGIEGTAPVPPETTEFQSAFELFRTAYVAEFNVEPNVFDPHTYDAVFVISLAMYAADSTDPAVFKEKLRDVSSPPGTIIRPGQWAEAIQALDAGQDIDYSGASGAANFDAFGEVGSDYEVWRVDENGQIQRIEFIAESDLPAGAPPAPASYVQKPGASIQQITESPKIGTVLPLTGALADFGTTMQKAANLAMKHVNDGGGIRGFSLTLVHEDSQTVPAAGRDAATKLINVDQVSAIVGAAASSVSQQVFAVAEPAGVLEMSPASTSPIFTDLDQSDLFWRTAPSDALQGKAAGLYAKNIRGWNTMAVLHINNAYGVGLGQVFADTFTSLGGEIVRIVPYEPDQASYTSVLESLFAPQAQAAPPAPFGRLN